MEGTGLVLSGGGGKGIYQVGMLKALAEAGKLDDVVAVSGTSIGCVNAILFAEGIAEGKSETSNGLAHAIEQMEQVWNETDYGVFFNIDYKALKAGDLHFSRNSTIDLMDEYINYSFFDNSNDMQIMPMYCAVAKCPPEVQSSEEITNEELKLLTNREEAVYRNYELKYLDFMGKDKNYVRNAVLASTALPVIYKPVSMNGELYIDGGVRDNVPIKPLYDMGLRKFIVIELSSRSFAAFDKFPDAEFVSIYPSRSLGGLFGGTMCFDKEDLAIKKELGYRDGKRYLKTRFEKDEYFISLEPAMAERDFQDILKQRQFQKTYDSLNNDISGRFDYINKLEESLDGHFKES